MVLEIDREGAVEQLDQALELSAAQELTCAIEAHNARQRAILRHD